MFTVGIDVGRGGGCLIGRGGFFADKYGNPAVKIDGLKKMPHVWLKFVIKKPNNHFFLRNV